MSEVQTRIATTEVGGAKSAARAAVARAAQATGVDFRYLLGQAKLESSLNPNARAAGSSAAGLFQFTRGTWQRTLSRHADAHGLGWAAGVAGGAAAQALRFDADASAMMAAELARDNGAMLSAQLGRQPDAAELYLAHFLGAGGASRFLATLASDPGRSAAALLPDAAAANRAVFYGAGGARSVGDVMALLRGRMANAMGDGGGSLEGDGALAAYDGDDGIDDLGLDPSAAFNPQIAYAQVSMGSAGMMPPPASSPWPGASVAPPVAASGRTSMADVLGNAFGLSSSGQRGGASQAPGFVRSAYAQLREWNL